MTTRPAPDARRRQRPEPGRDGDHPAALPDHRPRHRRGRLRPHRSARHHADDARRIEPDLARRQAADAATAMRAMNTRPINFDDGSSKVILSVLKRATRPDHQLRQDLPLPALRARHLSGHQQVDHARRRQLLAAQLRGRQLRRQFRPQPSGPANIVGVQGGLIYVTEIYTRDRLMTPLDRFGITVPSTLYSIADF